MHNTSGFYLFSIEMQKKVEVTAVDFVILEIQFFNEKILP